MPLSRRGFVRTLSIGGAGALGASFVGARGHEALRALDAAALPLPPTARTGKALRLDSNENPYGAAPAALDAVRAAFVEASRYPGDATATLVEAIAAAHGVKPENVLLGAGSTEVLRMAVLAFTGRDRALVSAAPTFEEPARVAEAAGTEVRAVRVDGAMRLDLAAMADRSAPGAGLVFLCNPNNPTSTVHPAAAVRDFVAQVRRRSPATVVLVDEAYHEFVDDPGYASAVPLALADPRVVVARTFSKVFGLAGLRVGYALGARATLDEMRRHKLGLAVSGLAAAAALATLGLRDFADGQRALNRQAREYTRRALADAGFASAASEANFLLVDIRRDARAFQDACASRGVLVGRPFPPLITHTRISIGTMAEMRQAVPILRQVLAG